MTHSHRMPHRFARLATITGVVLAALGVGALIAGSALYDSGVLAFPILLQIAVLAGEVGFGTVPCVMLLRAAQLARKEDVAQARSASVTGGLVLLPCIGAAALFRLVANPCWDNPTYSGGASFEDGILKAGILILLLAAVMALLLSPIFLVLVRRSADQRSR